MNHAKAAQIPLRFAASKLAEGDSMILEQLKLDDNERGHAGPISYDRWKKNADLTRLQLLQI